MRRKIKHLAILALLGIGVFGYWGISLGQGYFFARGGTAVSSLNTSLISYWKLDEASGTRVDSEPTGTPQDLTDNGTTGSNPGIIDDAGQFTAANNEFLSRADSADLSVGDIDFTVAAWVYLDTKPSPGNIISKGASVYRIRYFGGATDRFQWIVGVSAAQADANNFGSPSTATWYLIIAWHDAANNQIGISVNNGTPNTAALVGGATDTTADFNIGSLDSSTSGEWDGRIDEVGFWKKVLSADERTELYNAGVGKTCCPF